MSLGPRLHVEGGAKAGLFFNAAGQNGALTTSAGPSPAAGVTDQAGVVLETQSALVYCLGRNVSVRGGYALLEITGLALAPEQLGVTDFSTGTGVHCHADALYHGAFLQLEYAY